MWSKVASRQIDAQLRERRRGFKRRREALERIQAAAGELEARIAEVEAQDGHLLELERQLARVADEMLSVARGGVDERTQPFPDPRLRQAAA
jgi:hypothetical protein